MNLTYTNVNGYNIPDLTVPQQDGNLNRWGRARLNFLRNHKPLMHTLMMTECTLWPHLMETQRVATERLDLMIAQASAAQGVTESLKERDQMAWVRLMNSIRLAAEDAVMREIIYS